MSVKMLVAAGAIFGLGTIAMGDVLYSQSFENTDALGGKYFDTGDADVAHDLVNNAGEAWVDVDGMNAAYIPFDSPWRWVDRRRLCWRHDLHRRHRRL